LYYYGARWYDPALGHFLQPDTIIPQPGNVLDYHRYSYTRFNPLKYNDPTGHFTALTQRAFSPGLGGGAALPLTGGNKVALTIAGSAGAAATLNAGLAAGSPPSQADALPPLLESFPGQTAGASSTSFPLADGGPQTSIPPSTGVYNNTLNLLADPLPGVDPTGHIVFNAVDDIFANPTTLQGKSPADIQPTIDEAANSGKWELGTLRQGSHRGQGMVLREVNEHGKYTGRMIQWHPGGGHHGPEPYWKVSSPQGGTVRIGPQFEN
jgi:hypothetical protein